MTDAPCDFVTGAIGGAAVPTQKDTLRSPLKPEDRRKQVSAHAADYDPFSEEGDHDWLLHNEIEGLFSQDADVDFFNVHSLAF